MNSPSSLDKTDRWSKLVLKVTTHKFNNVRKISQQLLKIFSQSWMLTTSGISKTGHDDNSFLSELFKRGQFSR